MKICRIFGIDIYLDWSWWLALIFFGWLYRGVFKWQFPEIPLAASWIFGILVVLGLFASVLFHELAHSLIAKKNKLPIFKITLMLFGGVAHLEKEPEKWGVEFWMSVAGPLSNLVLAGIFWAICLAASSFLRMESNIYIGASYFLLQLFFQINLILAIFNLLPAFPLDGGRVLRAILWKATKSFGKATKWAAGVGQVLGASMIIYGILDTFIFHLFGSLMLSFIGILVFLWARQSYKSVDKRNPD